MKLIDIVVPVYNEERGIRQFHLALTNALTDLTSRYRFHLIYVLDRSSDDSFAILKALAQEYPDVTVLHLSRRFGHQMSLVAGIDCSSGDALIMMDSDLQHPPAVIPLLLEKFEQGFDIVHTIREYDRRIPVTKRWTSRFFYQIQNALSPVEIVEGAADFRLISRKVTLVFQQSVREQNQFLRGLFRWIGFRTTSVHFTSPPRVAGSTKYNFMRLLAFSVTGITSFSKVPLRFAAFLGFAISGLSACYALVLVWEFFRRGHFPPGYTSLILVMLIIGGLQLSVLGILGEYIGSIFDEVKRRPLYVIEDALRSASVSPQQELPALPMRMQPD